MNDSALGLTRQETQWSVQTPSCPLSAILIRHNHVLILLGGITIYAYNICGGFPHFEGGRPRKANPSCHCFPLAHLDDRVSHCAGSHQTMASFQNEVYCVFVPDVFMCTCEDVRVGEFVMDGKNNLCCPLKKVVADTNTILQYPLVLVYLSVLFI